MIHIYIYSRIRKKKGMISRLKSPLSFNSLKWKFYVDIVSTGQQCLVETKGGTARILQRGGDGGTKSLTGILQLRKWCYRLRGIKDNSLPSRIAAKAQDGMFRVYKSKLKQREREKERRQRFLSSRWRKWRVVRVKTNAIRCVQVVWESVLLETSAKRGRRKLDSFFIAQIIGTIKETIGIKWNWSVKRVFSYISSLKLKKKKKFRVLSPFKFE